MIECPVLVGQSTPSRQLDSSHRLGAHSTAVFESHLSSRAGRVWNDATLPVTPSALQGLRARNAWHSAPTDVPNWLPTWSDGDRPAVRLHDTLSVDELHVELCVAIDHDLSMAHRPKRLDGRWWGSLGISVPVFAEEDWPESDWDWSTPR